MPIALIVIGALLALFGFGSVITVADTRFSAPQQTVVALWAIQGALGLILIGLGALLRSCQRGVKAAEEIYYRLTPAVAPTDRSSPKPPRASPVWPFDRPKDQPAEPAMPASDRW